MIFQTETLRKLAFGALAVLALVVATDTAFQIAGKYNGPNSLEIENGMLKAELDSLRAQSVAAEKLAKYWAAQATESSQKQTIINKYYNEEVTRHLARPFSVRSRVFSETLTRLDTIGRGSY